MVQLLPPAAVPLHLLLHARALIASAGRHPDKNTDPSAGRRFVEIRCGRRAHVPRLCRAASHDAFSPSPALRGAATPMRS